MARDAIIVDGTIISERINEAHKEIRAIAESFKKVNSEVDSITKTVKQNWVGEGRNEFQTQYDMLITKIDDFGDTLIDIYEALVEAEAEYQTADDSLRKDFVKAKGEE